jgi:tetratricopeptide (TPR) repeat protein/tRNA A-37 threonylcarbamoyl transferase component Bud32
MGSTPCPAADTLKAFVAGSLSGVDLEAVAAHVDGCRTCLNRVQQLDPGYDPLLAAIGQADPGNPFAQEPQCAEALARLQNCPGPDAASPTTDDTPRSGGETDAAPAGPPAGVPRYRPLHLHAQGGLGEVHVAEDAELHRRVALKRLQPHQAQSPDSRRRFLREAEITSKLEHPGVVPIHGLVADENGQPCYAMRFIEGESLKEAIQRFHDADRDPKRDPGERNLALRQLLGQFVAVCKTMAFAHNRGVIHRDLKPGNIMLGRYGETLVVDWGLAKTVQRSDEARASGEETVQPSGAAGESATRTGQVAGTPAYMSPEQAAGMLGQLGPPSDIYGLGATLYVMLTGQPPFQGGNLLQQVQRGAVVRPRHVKPAVPLALEAICIKAMALKPEERYATALDLAADVEHWLADEPVRAYAEGWATRLRRWGRRHRPLVAGLTAAAVVGLVLGGAGWWWLERQEAERREQVARLEGRDQEAIDTALQQAEGFMRKAQWPESQAALAQAEKRLADGGPAPLQERLRQARDNLGLVQRLDAIRLEAATLVDGKWSPRRAAPAYASAFRQHGLDVQRGREPDLARRIAASPVKEQLVAALEDWAWSDAQLGPRLLALARQADPDPERDRLRDPQLWRAGRELVHRAGQADVGRLSPALVSAVGCLLEDMGGPGVEFLERGQRRFPGDFWLNFNLGTALSRKARGRWEEAIGYFRAALALRRATAPVYSNLGVALLYKGDPDGAIAALQQAIALEPKSAQTRTNLGLALARKGDLAGAVAAHRQALAIDPQLAVVHNNLGTALAEKGDLAGAIAAHHQAIALKRTYAPAYYNLGLALHAQGDLNGAIAAYQKVLALAPKYAPAANNLGNVRRAQGDLDGAIAAYKQALAVAPKYAKAHFNLGLALTAKGDVKGAIAAYQRAVGFDPKLGPAHSALGGALLAQGRFTEARTATRTALQLLSPTEPLYQVVTRQLRQCELWQKLDTRLPAILNGEVKAADAAEQLALAELCVQYKQRYAAAARFFADAFAANSKLADDMERQQRYNAACAAALAAAGQGADAGKLEGKERARLRQQALTWLRADLTAWTKVAEKGPAGAKAVVRQTLAHWQKDPDLAGVRDKTCMAKLPQDERQAWQQLWADVDTLLKQAKAAK